MLYVDEGRIYTHQSKIEKLPLGVRSANSKKSRQASEKFWSQHEKHIHVQMERDQVSFGGYTP